MTPLQPRPMPPARDWFDDYWDAHCAKLPFILRNDHGKQLARQLVEQLIDGFSRQASTPEAARMLIAFGRIAAILKGAQGVLDAPDPSPDQVADAVQKLVEKAVHP